MNKEEAIAILQNMTNSRERMRAHVASDERLLELLDAETQATNMACEALQRSWSPSLTLASAFKRKQSPLEALRGRARAK
ncbi:MAG: hypothetical protein JWN93_637 [Hyphomicrobiales bacterium]|jgi:hypothetical protein|nr:hypothetical protein [Hyphomicrobiales bacterium]